MSKGAPEDKCSADRQASIQPWEVCSVSYFLSTWVILSLLQVSSERAVIILSD